MRQQPEKAEQAAIVQLLKTLGASVYVLGVRRRKGDHQGTMQTPGIPDLYCVIAASAQYRVSHQHWPPNVCVWIEVKAKDGKLSPAQKQFEGESVAANMPHIVGGIDAVTDWLRQGGWIK